MEQAKQQEPEIYTKETCQEFHLVLWRLLEDYFKSLNNLDALKQQPATGRSPEQIVRQLQLVARLGNFTRIMVTGSSIKNHLKTTECALPGRLEFAKLTETDDQEAQVLTEIEMEKIPLIPLSALRCLLQK